MNSAIVKLVRHEKNKIWRSRKYCNQINKPYKSDKKENSGTRQRLFEVLCELTEAKRVFDEAHMATKAPHFRFGFSSGDMD